MKEGGSRGGGGKQTTENFSMSLLGCEVSPLLAPLRDSGERAWQRPGRRIVKVTAKLEQCGSQGLGH